jgi:archaellum component FlaC
MFQIILVVFYCIHKKEELLKENMKTVNGFNSDGVVKFILNFGGKCRDMIVKIVYDNKKDRELIESVEFSTPFFVEYIDALTKKNADLIEELKVATKVYMAATAREDDIAFYKKSNAELKKKNEAIHEEAKRWKKEATLAQKELDTWTAKYNALKHQFDKLKDEDREWTSANPAVQASLERKINVLEKEINKYKAQASEWEAKYEYQDGQTDCVIKDYNELNKKYESLRMDYTALSRRHDDLVATYSDNVVKKKCLDELNKKYTALHAEHKVLSSKYNDMVKYFESRSDKKYLEERVKDLILQCDELYDKNKELDTENAYLTEEVDKLKNKLKDAESRYVYLHNKCNRLKSLINQTYGIASGIPYIKDTDDFEDRARKCAIIFSKTIDDMILAYDLDVNSYDDSSIEGITKIVNTVREGHIWLDALENSMKKFSEGAEKYIKKVGGKND